ADDGNEDRLGAEGAQETRQFFGLMRRPGDHHAHALKDHVAASLRGKREGRAGVEMSLDAARTSACATFS
ncbi:MAG: hypothetical protein ACRD34_02675, partial [Bryobacteraceae bacterium]